MAAKAREEQELLRAQVAALEARLADVGKTPGKTRTARSAPQSPEGKSDRQR